MIENAAVLGERTRETLSKLNSDVVVHHRGKGLLNAVVITKTQSKSFVLVGGEVTFHH